MTILVTKERGSSEDLRKNSRGSWGGNQITVSPKNDKWQIWTANLENLDVERQKNEKRVSEKNGEKNGSLYSPPHFPFHIATTLTTAS